MNLSYRESTWNCLDAISFFNTGNWIHFKWPSREQGINSFIFVPATTQHVQIMYKQEHRKDTQNSWFRDYMHGTSVYTAHLISWLLCVMYLLLFVCLFQLLTLLVKEKSMFYRMSVLQKQIQTQTYCRHRYRYVFLSL